MSNTCIACSRPFCAAVKGAGSEEGEGEGGEFAKRKPAMERAAFHCHWKASCQPERMEVVVRVWCIRVVIVRAWERHRWDRRLAVVLWSGDGAEGDGKHMNGRYKLSERLW